MFRTTSLSFFFFVAVCSIDNLTCVISGATMRASLSRSICLHVSTLCIAFCNAMQ